MLEFTQCGSRLFGIYASGDPTKFQDGIGNKSVNWGVVLTFWARNVLVESGTTCQVDFFRPKVDFNDFWPAKSIQRANIYVSGEFEKNRSRSHFALSRDQVAYEQN